MGNSGDGHMFSFIDRDQPGEDRTKGVIGAREPTLALNRNCGS
jgi:hypothetical protein